MTQRKVSSITLSTDGSRIDGVFTDHEGHMVTILSGDSFDGIPDAVEKMVLLMQHRNGILNYKSDGSISSSITPELEPQLKAIAAADKGTGW